MTPRADTMRIQLDASLEEFRFTERLCGFAKDIFSEAAKYSGAMVGSCDVVK